MLEENGGIVCKLGNIVFKKKSRAVQAAFDVASLSPFEVQTPGSPLCKFAMMPDVCFAKVSWPWTFTGVIIRGKLLSDRFRHAPVSDDQVGTVSRDLDSRHLSCAATSFFEHSPPQAA